MMRFEGIITGACLIIQLKNRRHFSSGFLVLVCRCALILRRISEASNAFSALASRLVLCRSTFVPQ